MQVHWNHRFVLEFQHQDQNLPGLSLHIEETRRKPQLLRALLIEHLPLVPVAQEHLFSRLLASGPLRSSWFPSRRRSLQRTKIRRKRNSTSWILLTVIRCLHHETGVCQQNSSPLDDASSSHIQPVIYVLDYVIRCDTASFFVYFSRFLLCNIWSRWPWEVELLHICSKYVTEETASHFRVVSFLIHSPQPPRLYKADTVHRMSTWKFSSIVVILLLSVATAYSSFYSLFSLLFHLLL